MPHPSASIDRAWRYLLSNHTHDANGGCAPDAVCQDMEYRYRKVRDLGEIVVDHSMQHIARNLSPADLPSDGAQLIVFNSLPYPREAVIALNIHVPREWKARSLRFEHESDPAVQCQPVTAENSSILVDSPWDVPTIMNTTGIRQHARFRNLPAAGWRVYRIHPCAEELRPASSLVTGPDSMENDWLRVRINPNGTMNLHHKASGADYSDLNYFTDEGEGGDAWHHIDLPHDMKISSLGAHASIAVVESGPLVSSIRASLEMPVPEACVNGSRRGAGRTLLKMEVLYTLRACSPWVEVTVAVDNTAADHWLRANFPTDAASDRNWADTHFDIVSRLIELPDSTGWVEKALGTHPLQTFADIHDGRRGLAVFPKGLFEYEAFDDRRRTLSLTLLRAFRISLAVSEEKKVELPDSGSQCPGMQTVEYALCPHAAMSLTHGC